MNPMFVATLAIVALSGLADATLWTVATTSTAATATAGATTTTTIGLSGLATVGLLGGVAILKGILIARLLASRRGKRSAESNDESVYAILNNAEPAQCFHRLICDLAAGAIPDNDKILSLFNNEASPVSPKFEYVTAAKVGKIVKNAALCEVRYSCPLNSQEIAKLF